MTGPGALLAVALGLLPVLVFLAGLVYLDGFKLTPLRRVLWVIAGGAAMAVVAFAVNAWLLDALALDMRPFSRYVSPLVEELLKALVVVGLFRTHRIGFLVDGAILGFAVGAGFAVVENVYYLFTADANVGIWVVRGFGTALMHGGATAIFALVSQAATDRQLQGGLPYYLPGLGAAVVLHSAFNHFLFTPPLMTLLVLAVLPPLLWLVFRRSATHVHDWLELDFDADARLLAEINSGQFTDTHIGEYLADLRERFEGPVVVDLLCYLRVYTELALGAKGMLMMREHGIDAPVSETIVENFAELDYLEKSIGRAGLLAIRPFLHMTRKDLWQIYVLSDHARRSR